MKRIAVAIGALLAFGVGASVSLGDLNAAPPITIEAPASVEATDSSGADVTFHVKSHADPPADITCTPAGGPGQSFDATAHLPVGKSTISCSDGTNSASVDVTVQDTTPPSVSVPGSVSDSTTDPGGKVVSWGGVSATDTVDGSLAVTCTPSSGSNFPIGTTAVNCTATDSHGNTGSNGFTVTLTLDDQVAPTFTSVPGSQTVEATSTGGASVSYPAPTATDNSGITPTINCDHASGSVYPLGPTTVACTATDGANNSTQASFTITVQDTTAPTLSLPGDMSVETESPAGAAVSYSAGASDVSAGAIAANCTPASGSTFALGTAHVNCTADDGHGNTASGGFNITVVLVDHTAPTLSNVPGNRSVEANGPGGSIVNYTSPTATDSLDGPIAVVGCSPASGSVFALGTTTVLCSAADAHGNTGTASFLISVVDTVPPSLVVPAARSVYATSDAGISDSDPAVTTFISAASAADLVDPHPVVTSDVHSLVPVGENVITFIARDASGNAVTRQATLTVLPVPPPGTPPLPTPPTAGPPQNVRALKAEAGDARVRLSWQLPAGIDHVVVTRSLAAGGDPQDVYTGKAESFLDRTVVNGLEYRYLVVSIDAAGNASAGVAAVALPKASLLRSPKEGARLKKPPKLAWARNAEATYYNVQLFRGEKKILSAWPNRAGLTLKRTWKFERRKYTLAPGTYRWYVWPGYGPRSAVDYGEMLGFSTFQIVR